MHEVFAVLSIRPSTCQSSGRYSVENCQQLLKIGPLKEVVVGNSSDGCCTIHLLFDSNLSLPHINVSKRFTKQCGVFP